MIFKLTTRYWPGDRLRLRIRELSLKFYYCLARAIRIWAAESGLVGRWGKKFDSFVFLGDNAGLLNYLLA
jgi:hypothetical protein